MGITTVGMRQSDSLILTWRGSGFGEQLMLARVVAILNDNGVKVFLKEKKKVAGLVDCPKLSSGYKSHFWYYDIKDRNPMVVQHIRHYEEVFGRRIEITRDCIPTVFYDVDTPTYDVVIHGSSGSWSSYRVWPYFDELEKMLEKNKVSFIRIDDRKKYGRIGGVKFLNYVKRAKLYLGLETGPSHYVSDIGRGKTLIIQSGFSDFDFWAYMYKFDHLKVDVPCSPCFLNKHDVYEGSGCQYNHRCMREISPQTVFNKIMEMIYEM